MDGRGRGRGSKRSGEVRIRDEEERRGEREERGANRDQNKDRALCNSIRGFVRLSVRQSVHHAFLTHSKNRVPGTRKHQGTLRISFIQSIDSTHSPLVFASNSKLRATPRALLRGFFTLTQWARLSEMKISWRSLTTTPLGNSRCLEHPNLERTFPIWSKIITRITWTKRTIFSAFEVINNQKLRIIIKPSLTTFGTWHLRILIT